MNTLRSIYILIGISLLSAIIFIPDWFEDPRRLLPGEWQDSGRRGRIEATEEYLQIYGVGSEEPIPYEWLQTDDEPYTLQVSYGRHTISADIIFNGKDEVIANLDIMHKLPREAADTMRQKNRSAGRPENEFRLIFRRIIPENKKN